MPQPNKNETESEYIGRCVRVVMGEGKSRQQALGKCYGMWKGAKDAEVEGAKKEGDEERGLA